MCGVCGHTLTSAQWAALSRCGDGVLAGNHRTANRGAFNRASMTYAAPAGVRGGIERLCVSVLLPFKQTAVTYRTTVPIAHRMCALLRTQLLLTQHDSALENTNALC